MWGRESYENTSVLAHLTVPFTMCVRVCGRRGRGQHLRRKSQLWSSMVPRGGTNQP